MEKHNEKTPIYRYIEILCTPNKHFNSAIRPCTSGCCCGKAQVFQMWKVFEKKVIADYGAAGGYRSKS
jgi:hypothetical protein